MKFEFATAQRIVFGAGTFDGVAPMAAEMGRRVFVVTDPHVPAAGRLVEQLAARGLAIETTDATGEPTVASVTAAIGQARATNCEVVIGLGGGSAIDTAKAVAALLAHPGSPLDYMEVVGAGKPLTRPSAPLIAIPTTAGTGAEVTRNAVIGSPDHGVKASMRGPTLLPRVAIVDPVLTHSAPPAVTASTGLDALTQVIEPFVSNAANPMTDALCREGMTRAARSLRRAYENSADAAAREDMALASLFGGMALANAKLGAVHGFAAVLGGMLHAPHGALCAVLLPAVMEANIRALRERDPQSPALDRYEEVARRLTGQPIACAAEGADWVRDLCCALQIPPLSGYGLTPGDLPPVAAQSRKASSMKGNPIALTEEELIGILMSSL